MDSEELKTVISKAWSALDALQLSPDPNTRHRALMIREAFRRLDRPNSIHNEIAGGGEPPRLWLDLFLHEYKLLREYFLRDPQGMLECAEAGQNPAKYAIAAAITNATAAYDMAYQVYHEYNPIDGG